MTYALVSHPDHHFEIIDIGRGSPEGQLLNAFQELVGGYIEVVLDPLGEWHLYCNEDGKNMGLRTNTVSTTFIDHLYNKAGRGLFSQYDRLVGTVVWLGPITAGRSENISLELVHEFTGWALAWTWVEAQSDSPLDSPDVPVFSVVRDGNDVWLYDRADDVVTRKIMDSVVQARKRESHGTIDVWSFIPPQAWAWDEFRATIMDDTAVTVHDERIHPSSS